MRAASGLIAALAGALVLAASASALTPNDPGWYMQWAERSMRLPAVWDHTTGSAEVVIAAVDTGVASGRNEHLVDFEGAVLPGWDFTDGDAETNDEHGHGTLAAGIMVARGNNGWGIAGHCWKCRLLPVKVSANGFAADGVIARGIRYAVDRGARIVTIGMVREDGSRPDDVLADAIEYAVAKGVLLVTPAGNNGNEARTYPGAYPGVLAVAGTDEQDKLFSWSTFGSWVPLAAPGCHALVSSEGSWGWHCGTSFTAPEIAGVAALALSLRPELSAEQIVASLRATAVPVAGIDGGRVDAYAALRHMGAIAPAPPPSPRTTVVTTSRRGAVRRGTRVSFSAETGRLRLSLAVTPSEACTLAVSGGSEILLGSARKRGLSSLDERVTGGRYTAEVTCRTAKRKRYRLTITAVRPATRPARLSGR